MSITDILQKSSAAFQHRLIGSTTSFNVHTETFQVDVGNILRRLLLFDTYILESVRLLEIPDMVRLLGLQGTLELLRSRALRIYLNALSITQTGQAAVFESRERKGILPQGSFCFDSINIYDRKTYIAGCFREAIDPLPISIKDQQKLKNAILDSLESPPAGIGREAVEQLKADLRIGNPALTLSTAKQIKRQAGLDVEPEQVLIRLHPLDEDDFRSESNLDTLFGLNTGLCHKIIERAVLELGGVNQRIAEMHAFNALSGFRVNDLPIFELKLAFLASAIDPNFQENRTRHLFEILDLPDFSDIGTVYRFDVDSFLEVRESRECREFRAWLPSIDQLEAKEIKQLVHNLRTRIATALQSSSGRIIRFLTSNAFGLVPGVGTVLGIGVSALDSFVVDKLFKESGIVTFVSRMYPALFEERPN